MVKSVSCMTSWDETVLKNVNNGKKTSLFW